MAKRKLTDAEPEEDWTNEERVQLLQSLQSQCPSDDRVSFSTRASKVDWENVQVEGRTPEQCQAEWASLLSKVRKFRTLSEIVEDAKDMVLHPEHFPRNKHKADKHPDQPAKPLTAYFQFIRDNREKIKASNPELKNTELLRLMSQKWMALSPKKRSKYLDRYHKEWQEFQEANGRFLEQHPELAMKSQPKPPSPFNLYFQSKEKSYKEKHQEMNTGQIRQKLRKKYTKLSPEKKKKWIDKALAAVTDYEEKIRLYQKAHPDFEPPMKKVRLTREEEAINGGVVKNGPRGRKKFPGAPVKPPRSAFHVFLKKKIGSVEGSLNERMTAVGQQWKELGDKQKKYQKKLKKLQAAYAEKLEEYKQTLTEEELTEFEESLKTPKRKRKISSTDST